MDLRLGLNLCPGTKIYIFYHQNLDDMEYHILSYMI